MPQVTPIRSPALPPHPPAGASRTTLALAAGWDAAGARYVKPGFARSPDMDLAFALGFPHLRYVTDDWADEDPEAAAREAIDLYHYDTRLVWPRASAAALVRAVAAEHDAKWAHGGAPGADEARAMMVERMDLGRVPDRFTSVLSVQLLEALVGTGPVVDGMLEGLALRAARAPAEDEHWGDVTTWELGYLLLRLPAPAADAARARLEDLAAELRSRHELDDIAVALDMVLHGRAGAERSAYRPDEGGAISPFLLGHVLDAPLFVAAHVVASGRPDVSSRPDARLAFLGGAPVLDHVRKHWSRYRGTGVHAYIVATFGEIAPTAVCTMIADIARSSHARRQAAAWLETFALESLYGLAR